MPIMLLFIVHYIWYTNTLHLPVSAADKIKRKKRK
uniref:Uncharacterized protein n=1 Tax=Anguilla anguilla TaxID=7936 RepID=A0A0E9XUN3_ANGAN